MFGLEIFGVLLKGLRILWGFDFCPHLIIPAFETRCTPPPASPWVGLGGYKKKDGMA